MCGEVEATWISFAVCLMFWCVDAAVGPEQRQTIHCRTFREMLFFICLLSIFWDGNREIKVE